MQKSPLQKRANHPHPHHSQMNPEDIAKKYDQLAHIWNDDAFPRDDGIEQHERALAFVEDGRFALDVGCGSSGRFIDLLTSRGFEVEGLDISERMIEFARKRHPEIVFHLADICSWELPRRFDFVSAWDSIWHLPLSKQEPVLKKLLDGLAPGGVCIFTTGGLDGPEEKTDTSMGPEVYYSVLGIPHTLDVIAGSGCICRHLEYDQYPESHLYIIAQKRKARCAST